MTYCKDYCEEKGISTSKLSEPQQTLYYIAENMKMKESISERGYKHFQMAIKALDQEPCEDAISRQAAINAMIKREQDDIDRYGCSIPEGFDSISAIEVLNGLPPVTPQSKIGKWIKYASPRCGEQHYKCTNCDDYVNFGQYGDYYTKDFKFCPHCGAKMESEEDI